MALNTFSENLIALRNKHNLNTTQVAAIAEIERTSYEKMELGFEQVSYEVLDKLAKFYGVDVSYFAQVHEEAQPKQSQEKKQSTEKAFGTSSKANKVFNILGLVTAGLLFVWFVFIPIYIGYVDIYGTTISLYMYDLFYSNVISIIMAVILLIYPIWAIVNPILYMCSKKIDLGTYGFVSKIISVAFSGLSFVFAIVLIIKLTSLLAILYAVVSLIDLVFAILRLVTHLKDNKKAN